MTFPVMGLAGMANQYGEQQKIKAEGSSSYDPYTGRYYKPGSQEAWSIVGSHAAPHKVWGDKNLSPAEQAVAFFKPLGGIGSALVMKKRGERMEDSRVAALARIQSVLGETPEYKRSEEAGQVQQAYKTGASTTRELGDEMVSIAGTRASQEAPGLAIRKEQVGQFAESAIDNYIESGGVSSLGGMLKMREEQASSLMAISQQAATRKRQTEQDYTNALMNRAGMESQAAGMEGAGLQIGINEAGKEYQGQLAQTMPYAQLAITQTGNALAQQ